MSRERGGGDVITVGYPVMVTGRLLTIMGWRRWEGALRLFLKTKQFAFERRGVIPFGAFLCL